MEYKREILSITEDFPIKIFIQSTESLNHHWSDQIVLTFVLKGEIIIKINDKDYILKEKDLFLINKNSSYYIDKIDVNQVCVIEIEPNFFENSYNDFSYLRFNLNSSQCLEAEFQEYEYIRFIIAKIINKLYLNEKDSYIVVRKFLYELIEILANKYIDNSKDTISEENRLKNIIEFIKVNYREQISLSNISDYFHLTPQYISRYFSKQMGLTLYDFIRNYRLQKSVKDLRDNNINITDIALENGFPNSKSYFKAFKECYGITPHKYRKIKNEEFNGKCLEKEYAEFDYEEVLKNIFVHLNYKNKTTDNDSEIKEKYNINVNNSKGKLTKVWKKVAAFGRAAEGLRADWRKQLKLIQREIPFEYIRFHGILSDEMMVYSEDQNGNPQYNFSYVDDLIDFLLETNIKPFIELSYMPEQLANEKKYMFLWKANISIPKSIDKWTQLIENLIEHFILKYGIEEVRTWYFEALINQQYNSNDECYKLLKSTYKTIKKINSKLKIGINAYDLSENENLLGDLNSFFVTEDIIFDFISCFIYSIVPNDECLSPDALVQKVGQISHNHYLPQNIIKFCKYADKEYVKDKINVFIKNQRKFRFFKKEIFISEFNLNPDPRDLLHDTCFKSSFFIKNILDNFNKVDGIAYWAFSDIFDEINTDNSTFHGGLGFITKNGLKKPIYYAYQFLNKLGDIIVEKGDNYIVTKKCDNSFQILAYNYSDFINDNMKCGTEEVTFYDRYNVFNEKNINIFFVLSGLYGNFTKKTHKINREYGSVFDQYIRIGAPKHINSDDLNYLDKKSIYDYKAEEININESYVINEKMLPHEVMLVEIVPAKTHKV